MDGKKMEDITMLGREEKSGGDGDDESDIMIAYHAHASGAPEPNVHVQGRAIFAIPPPPAPSHPVAGASASSSASAHPRSNPHQGHHVGCCGGLGDEGDEPDGYDGHTPSKWFQGHVTCPWRVMGGGGQDSVTLALFATELETDPCLRCKLGGYGRFNLALIYKQPVSTQPQCGGEAPDHAAGEKEVSLVVETSGGDYLKLHTEQTGEIRQGEEHEYITYTSDKMSAGPSVLPLMRVFFQAMVRAVSGNEDALRECVVCQGDMWVPRQLLERLVGEEEVEEATDAEDSGEEDSGGAAAAAAAGDRGGDGGQPVAKGW